MGGLQKRATNRVYVNISKGTLVATINNEKQTFDELGGFLTDIKITEEEFKNKKFKRVTATITFGDVDYLLQMKLDSGYGRGFCQAIGNCNLTREIMISCKYEEKEGSETGTASLFINQNGWVKWQWTRDNMGELPQLEKIVYKDNEVWDNSKQLAFFEKFLLETIKPKLPHAAIAGEVIMETNPADAMIDGLKSHIKTPVDPSDISEPVDDLPF